ncbi:MULTISPECIES: anthranilate phosphoribosyltransferase family protein [unclassified Thermosynechococcus]|uniref:anthranilate phosphoribosyltransferase family protein n=1 Tax=unclassified Thermosynechococcus TaxID=2622553 RepID=UPI002872FA08|nr:MULTISPECIES: anthranilate phosphoribosyltransferase family protein [unclassified Thermosynechococcus]WNC30453.1 anthranilate phosphoribosyltransferase family protein [Thermosynechococcus sp. PKX82]WNC60848.1 anthranilate phosphoribosyltransferase family protein [Thermosynechococcus sp. QS41]
MSPLFRDLLKKVGSGAHTHKDLSRAEAALALQLMLEQVATPAQIGAFLIAHRIKRPTSEEMAGMLDAYNELGPKIPAVETSCPVMILSQPYDGRDRTFPLSPLTALVLAAAGIPVLQHGGDRIPTKEGIPLIELWRCLGVDWSTLTLEQITHCLEQTGLGFVYLPRHFPAAQGLVPYREQIGKRPPIATLELIWNPYQGRSHLVAGFVHPPTEGIMRDALYLHGVHEFTTVKGLEGSCDLPRERTAIIGLARDQDPPWQRLRLHPQEYGMASSNVPWPADTTTAAKMMAAVLAAEEQPLTTSVIWNSGFYLWQGGKADSLNSGLALSSELLRSGRVAQHLQKLQTMLEKI